MEKPDKDLPIGRKLARQLVLDELFDLTLYRELAGITSDGTRKMLEELIPIETRHHAFWLDFFQYAPEPMNMARRIKLRLIVAACRIFGDTAVHLALEAIEIYGIRKYLTVWQLYKDIPLGEAVKTVLNDEFQHEDAVVSGRTERKIRPERIRSIFLGLNDGLVEMIGAVSGFIAAFEKPSSVLIAGFTVAIAGSLSMAAGAYSASSSEEEVKRIETGKAKFLNTSLSDVPEENAYFLACLVGISYFFGAMMPMLPVLLGARTAWASIVTSGCVSILISSVLAFLSGMSIPKRAATNLLLLGMAVTITYGIGLLVRTFWSINT